MVAHAVRAAGSQTANNDRGLADPAARALVVRLVAVHALGLAGHCRVLRRTGAAAHFRHRSRVSGGCVSCACKFGHEHPCRGAQHRVVFIPAICWADVLKFGDGVGEHGVRICGNGYGSRTDHILEIRR